jgi:hypothetical protein
MEFKMSRSRNEKSKAWNPARRYLKKSLRERRRLSENIDYWE